LKISSDIFFSCERCYLGGIPNPVGPLEDTASSKHALQVRLTDPSYHLKRRTNLRKICFMKTPKSVGSAQNVSTLVIIKFRLPTARRM